MADGGRESFTAKDAKRNYFSKTRPSAGASAGTRGLIRWHITREGDAEVRHAWHTVI
jgi:hypothetical protein